MFLILTALLYCKGEPDILVLFFTLLDIIVGLSKQIRELRTCVNGSLYFRMSLVIVCNEGFRTCFNSLLCFVNGILNFRTQFWIILLKVVCKTVFTNRRRCIVYIIFSIPRVVDALDVMPEVV